MGISPGTLQSLDYAMKQGGKLDKALGLTKGISEGLAADAAIPKVGREISAQMNAITKETLGLTGQAQSRAFFRLGELLAKADPKVRAKGWAYAGYGNNTVNVADQEGINFRTRTGRSGKILGLEGHLAPDEFLGIRTEIGRRGELLKIMQSVLETAVRFRTALEAAGDKNERLQLFSSALGKWLGGSSWAEGVTRGFGAFLPEAGVLPEEFVSIIEAPRGSAGGGGSFDLSGGGGGGGGGDAGGGIGIGGIAAIAAAAVGAYFISQS
jgi:hypothetical protein